MKFPFVRPDIPTPDSWIGELTPAYSNRYFTNFGEAESKLTRRLTEKFAGSDVEVTLACNATIALAAALLAHGVRGNVVIPNFTFPATLQSVLAARCTPILCDVDSETCELDTNELQEILKVFSVAAVVPVRPYGFVRDMSELIGICQPLGIPVIVDSAAALGVANIKATELVTEVCSLHATKSFGIGEGAAVFSHSTMRPKIMRALNFGLNPDRTFEYGLNGKMSEFQAAVGLAQFAQIDRLSSERRAMASWYFEHLKEFTTLRYPIEPGLTAWSNFPVILPNNVDTATFELSCHQSGYQIRRYYWPAISEGFSEKLASASALGVSKKLSQQAVCLPLYSTVSKSELIEIGEILSNALRSANVR